MVQTAGKGTIPDLNTQRPLRVLLQGLEGRGAWGQLALKVRPFLRTSRA